MSSEDNGMLKAVAAKSIVLEQPQQNMPGFDKIRQVTERDVPKVLDLVRSIILFTPQEIEVIAAILRSYLKQERKWYECLCFKEGNTVLGFACYAPAVITTGTYDILWMAVTPTYQGKGIGSALLRHIEHQLQGEGVRLINIETSSQRSYARTRKFYENHGYKRVAFIRDYYRPGDGKVVYAKYFDAPINSATIPSLSLVVTA